MTEDRWDRLVQSLAAAGVEARLDQRPYRGGITKSISIRLADGLVEIHDKWWRKNDTVWIGWQVHAEGRDSIVRRTWSLTKKRGEVVASVLEARAA